MGNKYNEKIRRLTMAGLMTAFVTVSTMVIRIPVPATNGYIHPGDALVLLSGVLLGPLYGAFAAGIGSAFADLLSGYLVYAPATFLIKGVTALVAAVLYSYLSGRRKAMKNPSLLLPAIAAEAWMVIGYFLFECVLYTPAAAAVSVFSNLMQALGGIMIAMVLFPLLHRRLAEA